jgi:50S ribosomal protein L16 3-hydroxylase
MASQLLGGLNPREFLRRYWQKRPLLVRDAQPGFQGILTKSALARLAQRDDVESRIVECRGGQRNTRHGPFARVDLPRRNATLLVNGVNLHVPQADALLQRFDFVPQARLDDVMVSYATPGGGVGPHVDSYDVFLLQGPGRRAWRFGNRRVVVGPGDLLYLPPGVRHDGVALESCFTYSIGFRAPRGTELAAAFLDWLHERGLPEARYRDAGLKPAARPGRLPLEMVSFAAGLLRRIRWSRADVERFLGEYVSEPKAHVLFTPGRRRAGSRVSLDARTRLLYGARLFFINGESVEVRGAGAAFLRELADRRTAYLRPVAAKALAGLLSAWQRLGYVHVEKN